MTDERADGEDVELEVETDRTVDRESAPERRLADELGRVDLSTTAEGYVEARVTALETVDETTVRLTAALPHGPTVTFDLEKPVPWADSFLLARVVEDVGYDAASIEYVVGETVLLERADLETTTDDRTPSADATRSLANATLSALGSDVRLSVDRKPEWRLVDPRERGPDESARESTRRSGRAGVALALVGTLAAILGATVGATGGVVATGAVATYALPGVVVVLAGLWLLAVRSRR